MTMTKKEKNTATDTKKTFKLNGKQPQNVRSFY